MSRRPGETFSEMLQRQLGVMWMLFVGSPLIVGMLLLIVGAMGFALSLLFGAVMLAQRTYWFMKHDEWVVSICDVLGKNAAPESTLQWCSISTSWLGVNRLYWHAANTWDASLVPIAVCGVVTVVALAWCWIVKSIYEVLLPNGAHGS